MESKSHYNVIATDHCVKRVLLRSSFWSLFRANSDRIRKNTDQEKLRVWALFKQWIRLTQFTTSQKVTDCIN